MISVDDASARGRDLRLVNSIAHPHRPCQQCALCKKRDFSKYSHPKAWKNPSLLQQLQIAEPSLSIEPDSCICLLCRKDVSRITDGSFSPRWRKSAHIKRNCYISGCQNTDIKVTKHANPRDIVKLFEEECDDSACTSDEVTENVPLCTHHYMQWYRYTHTVQSNCTTCGKKLLSDYRTNRPVPEPELLQQFLLANTEFSGNLGPDDRVCCPCYKSHLVTVRHIKNVFVSTDAHLKSVIREIKQSTCTLSEIKTLENAIDYTVHILAVTVGEALLQQTAILLPQIYLRFKTEVGSIVRRCKVQTGGNDLPSHVWLRSSFSSLLQHHMAYRCSIPKYGTLLYRYGGDLVHALTVALWHCNAANSDSTSTPADDDTVLTQVCLSVNDKLNAQVNRLIKADAQQPHQFEQFDLNKFVDDLDPTIWKTVCLLTQAPNTKLTHVRKVRTAFTLCQIFFTINRQCSFPLHTLIADAIDTFGGSSRLKALLNRLGVSASSETLARYLQYRVEGRQKEGLLDLDVQTLDCPVIVSTDNLDYQQSYSRVYSGSQGIGWHGTTVQITLAGIQEPATRDTSNEITDRPISITDTHTSHVKRLYSTRSPHKNAALCSPQPKKPKKARRRRTGIEQRESIQLQPVPITILATPPSIEIPEHLSTRGPISMRHFELQVYENEALAKLREVCDEYIVFKLANEKNPENIVGLQMFYCLSQNVPCPKKTTIIYFKVLNEKCDNKETLLSVINDLYTEFILSGKKTHVVLEGDQVTYERLHSIRAEYGSESKWLILFPGDWHFLKNYQEVLIKIYFDAGLSDLAKACGYLPRSIGTNFKRTHRFLLESWEALYRVLMGHFLSKKAQSDFLPQVSALLQNFPLSFNQASAHRNLRELTETIGEMVYDAPDFETYMSNEAKQNPTLMFWMQFLLKDCLAYIALYLSIRSGHWHLRMAALKLMGPLFTGYDRPKYAKLIPLHIKEMFSIPADILSHLENGRFTVSILGRACHSVGIDECHEMSINKDCKEYIIRPSAENMTRMATFLPVRVQAIKNLESQIFADSKAKIPLTETVSLHTTNPETRKHETNVQVQVHKIQTDSKVLPTQHSEPSSKPLSHLFRTKQLRPEQAHDLSNFRVIGHTYQKQYIDYYILRTPSVKPPKHRKALLTFIEKKTRQKKGSQVEREHKLQLEVWKKRVSFAVTTGFKDNMSYQQCLELPRAIATPDGKPTKGAKANITKVYEKRYQHAKPPIITTVQPDEWSPDSVFEEGMFLINITPWSAHQTMGDYGDFLMKQHILTYFKNPSTTEVHLLFDNPNCIQQSPKYFEQLHRDQQNQVPDDHNCGGFSADMVIPPKWRQDILNCRQCKRNLVCFLSEFFLQKIRHRLRPNQKFVTAGGLQGAHGNKAMYVTTQTPPTIDERLSSNAEESDTRIWLHVLHSAGTRKLVLSPDTDVYHIGLRVIAETELDVIVRLSPFSSIEQRLLNLPALITSFKNDPDLAAVEEGEITHIMQTLFVITGCDYISFFNGIGKATFLHTLLEYSQFVTASDTNTPGTLTDETNGFLSFVRLVGCAYFKKHKSAFLPSFPNPMTLFNSVQPSINHKEHHEQWLDLIRDRIWSRIQFEEDMIPSVDALLRHWKRSCWVLSVWKQATANEIVYAPLEEYGWKKPDQTTLVIDWESEDNMSRIKQQVALIRKGCGCKTGCSSARCRCKKHKSHCGPGCKCTGCTNLAIEALSPQEMYDEETQDTESDSSSSITASSEHLEQQVDKLMDDIFGSSESEQNEYVPSTIV